MSIELDRDTRQAAVESIERYFVEYMDEPIGNLQARSLLAFFLEEIGPAVYNQAVADVQQRMQERVADLDFEVHEDAFGYWGKHARKGR
ncbi:DUF2164 domain-containing protein [Paludibacterium yongneupense]|uniref:DUF2164 domain-containing protein n=1 Tax=Paludibacterium yongneupense TaxID=400061 RepID=UPI000421B2C1|nr:DUF2164 domain-containing protein [Paludibacterium yongneupense]